MNDDGEREAGTLPVEPTPATRTKPRAPRAGLVKADLIAEVSRVAEISRKEAAGLVELIFDSMVRALRRGEHVELRRFGSFRTRQRQGRIGRNPRTGARVEVSPKRITFFVPSQELRALVNRISSTSPDGL